MDMASLALALAGGAAGKALGDSPITGNREWDKILGPVCAIVAASAYKKFGGAEDMTTEQAIQAGAFVGTLGVGIYSAGKGAVKFVRSLFTKGLK